MSELEELISLLYPKTMDGKLKWTIDGDYRIYSVQGENIIEIETDTDIEMFYMVRVRNHDGIILLSKVFYQDNEFFDNLQSIANKARRIALRVDEALHDLKERISSL